MTKQEAKFLKEFCLNKRNCISAGDCQYQKFCIENVGCGDHISIPGAEKIETLMKYPSPTNKPQQLEFAL